MAGNKKKKNVAKAAVAPASNKAQTAVAPENSVSMEASKEPVSVAQTVAADHGLSLNKDGKLVDRDGDRVTTITYNGSIYGTSSEDLICFIPKSIGDGNIYADAYNVPGRAIGERVVLPISECGFGIGHEFQFLDKDLGAEAPQAGEPDKNARMQAEIAEKKAVWAALLAAKVSSSTAHKPEAAKTEPKSAAADPVKTQPKKGAAAFMQEKVFTEQNFKRAVKVTAGCAFAFGAYKGGYVNPDRVANMFGWRPPVAGEFSLAAGFVTGVATAGIAAVGAFVTKFVFGAAADAITPGRTKSALKKVAVSGLLITSIIATSASNPGFSHDAERVYKHVKGILATTSTEHEQKKPVVMAEENSIAEGSLVHTMPGAIYSTTGNPQGIPNKGKFNRGYNARVDGVLSDGRLSLVLAFDEDIEIGAFVSPEDVKLGNLSLDELSKLGVNRSRTGNYIRPALIQSALNR